MRVFAFTLLLGCAPAVEAQTSALPSRETPVYNVPSRETLVYNVEWRLITAGKARIEWMADTQQRGWDLRLQLQSTGLVSKLFKVDDDYSVRMNEAFCLESSNLRALEGRRQRETRITVDRGKASYLERDVTKGSTVLAKEIDVPSCVHDVASGLYYIRTLALEPGQTTQVPVTDGKKSVMARVEAQQREEIKTLAGTFKTIRYEVFLFNNVLYQRNAHLYVWLSEDRSRLPVQIRVRMQFAIGTITLQLEKHE